jgi:hypothetical protein
VHDPQLTTGGTAMGIDLHHAAGISSDHNFGLAADEVG